MNKKGRPKGNITRSKQIHVSASDECINQLESLAELTGETKTEVVEKAIRVRYNLLKYGDDSYEN